jgi:hypothetical protein
MLNRDMPRRNVYNHLGDKEGIESGGLTGLIVPHLFHKSIKPAYTRGHDYAYGVLIQLAIQEARILNSFIRSNNGIMGKAIHFPGLPAVYILQGIKPLKLTREAGAK